MQDIALIRAAGYDVLSTNRGYVLNNLEKHTRTFKVHHIDEQLEEELFGIVDLGGYAENVMINHKGYGHLEASPPEITTMW